MSRRERRYTLKIGDPVILDKDFFTPVQTPTDQLVELGDYYNSESGNAYLITDHDISYRVNKTNDAAKNTCEITVKNLLKDTVKYVMANRGKSLYVEFDVGYVGEVKNLFKGTIKTATQAQNGVDHTLKLVVVDGAVNSEAFTTRFYPTGTPFNTIVNDIRLDMGTPIGRVVPFPVSVATSSPVSVFGNTCNTMEALAAQFDNDFTISEGMCYLTPKQEMHQEHAAYLSSTSGLIGSVHSLIKQGTQVKPTDADTSSSEHVKFKCQTDASIKPPFSVYLDDPDSGFVGIYKVERASFHCSSFSTGSFVVDVEAVKNDTLIAGG